VITKTVNFVRLRWLMIVLFSSLWATMGGAVSLAERGDFTGSAEALHSREERLDRASAEVADAFEAAFYKTVSDPDCLEQFLRKAAAEAVFAAATMGLSELRLLKGVGALDDVIAASKGVKAANSVAVRQGYLDALKAIPGKIDTTLPLREQAMQAFNLRNAAKIDARAAMADGGALLNKTDPIPTIQDVVRRAYQEKGLVGDDMWRSILESSTRSRASVN
jgi:hypothetical protein